MNTTSPDIAAPADARKVADWAHISEHGQLSRFFWGTERRNERLSVCVAGFQNADGSIGRREILVSIDGRA
jgi:hypothetical protein